MQNSNSNYSTFLDSYNTGNSFLDSSAQNFIERINVDKENIIQKDLGILRDKFAYINHIIEDRDKSNYEKLAITGNILSDIVPDIIQTQSPEVKNSGMNIIKSFFDVAKKTEDQQLLNTAVRIAESIPK